MAIDPGPVGREAFECLPTFSTSYARYQTLTRAGQTSASTLTDSNGRFYLVDLAPGTYAIRIQRVRPGMYDLVAIKSKRLAGASPAPTFPAYVGRTRIVVSSEDVRGITLTASRGSAVHGRLTNIKDFALPAGSNYRVRLAPAGLMPMIPYNFSAEALPEGTFTFPAVPELSYSVVLTGVSGDTYIADLLQDGRS